MFNGTFTGGTNTFNAFTGNFTTVAGTINFFTGTFTHASSFNLFSGAATAVGTTNIGTGTSAAHVTNIGSNAGGNVTIIGGSSSTIGIGLGGNAAQVITIGAAAQTGTISVGTSTGALIVDLMDGVAGGTQTLNIASWNIKYRCTKRQYFEWHNSRCYDNTNLFRWCGINR